MPKKINTEIFIQKAKLIHGDKYDYSLANYVHSHSKIKIICSEHGIFEQIAGNHLIGKTCRQCTIKNKSNNTENFIQRARIIHGNKYDYSLINYVNSSIKVKIICDNKHEFLQLPYAHLNGNGCPKCFKGSNTENFIQKAIKKHNNKYEYTLTEYKGSNKKIKIICTKHGVFEQTPHGHLKGYGCAKCGRENQGGIKLSTENFIKRGNLIHKNYYDYSLVNVINSYKKVKIICPKHGEFEQKPDAHLNSKQGCSKCNTFGNVSENKLLTFIKKSFPNEKILSQYTPNWLKTYNKNGGIQRFDIYFPDYNIAIEYQGVQHFRPIPFFGGEIGYNNMKRLDNKKLKLSIINNCYLLYFTYEKKYIPEDFNHKILTNENDLINYIYEIIKKPTTI